MYLPENWFQNMKKYQKDYDWFECERYNTIIIQYNEPNLKYRERAYSGCQMGRKKAFEYIIPKIDDDYLYRNEDIVLHYKDY